MKTLTIPLLFMFLAIVSCQKKHCWKCAITLYDTVLVPRSWGGMIITTKDSTATVCDMTKKESREFEKNNSLLIDYHRRTVDCSK
jgi:hypothetical protein